MGSEVCEECGTRCAVGVPRCPHCSSKRLVPEEALAGLVPSLTVACCNDACPAKDVERRVGLAQVVPGVLVLPRLVCARCGYELWKVREDIVPKITVHGGPSNAAADGVEVHPADGEHVLSTDAVKRAVEGGEDVSAGTSSSTSSATESTSPEPSETPDRSRARTTGNRSKKARTGSSSAAGTDGDPTAPTSDRT